MTVEVSAWKKLIPRNALSVLELAQGRGTPLKRMREVAVFFVDIEGCTRLCEDLPPQKMNEVKEVEMLPVKSAVRGRPQAVKPRHG